MKYYLGIDGGGTKTTYTVIDENEKVVSVTRSSGTSIDTYSRAQVTSIFKKAIEALPYKFSGVFAGLGGIACDEDANTVCGILSNIRNNKNAKIACGNDVDNALSGTIPNEDGIVLIAGTGSVAYGIHGDKHHRSGGYGYKEGDAGSAYWLGIKAIQHLAKVLDKRLPESSFSRAISDATNCYECYQLTKWLNEATRVQIAQLAVVVTSYSNNKAAKLILDWGITELIMMLENVYKECGFKKKVKFAIVGSLGTAETYYKRSLLNKLSTKKFQYVHGVHDAGMGSALLAKQLDKKSK